MGGAAALGAAGLIDGAAASAADGGGNDPSHGRHGRLPRRTEFVITDAYVMTMDDRLQDVPRGDVQVRNGVIVAVGKNLRRRGRRIDGTNTIVLPGFVDTHWHMWTTLFRSMASTSPATAYFPLNLRNGPAFRPQDMYHAVRLALADALNMGVTTVNDWAHNLQTPAHADANMRAHVHTGTRGRLTYGAPQGTPLTQVINLADLERVQKEWILSRRAELMHLGLGGRPPGLVGESVFKPEYEKARELGIPISYHANSNRAQGAAAMVRQLADRGMLGPHVQIIHALYTTAAEREALARSRSPVSISPWSELLIGYGVTPVKQLSDAGVLLNLSADTLSLTGTADMFSIVRLTLGLHRGQAESELAVGARRILQMATIDGARGLGLGDVTGSLTPGKRADLMMVRTDDVNIAPFTDAPNMIALAAQPHNVDTVVVDGRILKRHGELTAIDTRRVVSRATRSLAGVLARAATPAAGAAAVPRSPLAACCE